MGNKRKPLTKKIRFEVFKRDKFTCQYCGRSAPDVVLEVDHIKPVAEGGGNDIMNLVTSCIECNRGKGKRKLNDYTVLKKQMDQLQELAERREQLNMMMQWREQLVDLKSSEIDIVCNTFEKFTGYSVNEEGRRDVKKWLKQFSLNEILDAMDVSIDKYFYEGEFEGIREGAGKAFCKIPGICRIKQIEKSDKYDHRYYYLNYIAKAFRNRGWDCEKGFIQKFVFGCIKDESDFEVVKIQLNCHDEQFWFWNKVERIFGDDWRN